MWVFPWSTGRIGGRSALRATSAKWSGRHGERLWNHRERLFEQNPSSGRGRIDINSGNVLRLCASDPWVSLRPCSSRFPSRYCAASGFSNACIDDLSVIERDSLSRKATLKGLKQPIEDPRRAQLFWTQTYDLGVRRRACQIDGQRPHERQSIARLIFQRRARLSIQAQQDQRLEHHRPLHRRASGH